MFLNELLEQEQVLQSIPDEGKKMMVAIMENCRPFLQRTSRPLYRGMASSEPYGHMDFTRNRQSTSPTTVEILPILNQYLKKYFNVDRKNGAYFTGSFEQTDVFGDPYLCFPKGKFEWHWHPRIYDYASKILSISHGEEEYLKQFDEQGKNEEIVRMFWESFGDSFVVNQRLDEAIKSGKEIFINGHNGYYFINYFRLQELAPGYTPEGFINTIKSNRQIISQWKDDL